MRIPVHVATCPLMKKKKFIGVRAMVATLSCLAGCSSYHTSPSQDRDWVYFWKGRARNLTGCPALEPKDKRRVFLIPTCEVLRRDSRQLVIAFQDEVPPTALVLCFDVPPSMGPKGEWKATTAGGSLRAWLVRKPTSMFEQVWSGKIDYNPFNLVDRPRLSALAESPSGAESPDPLAFPMVGKAIVRTDADRVRWVQVDLQTAGPMPVYRDYAKNIIRVESHTRGLFGDPA